MLVDLEAAELILRHAICSALWILCFWFLRVLAQHVIGDSGWVALGFEIVEEVTLIGVVALFSWNVAVDFWNRRSRPKGSNGSFPFSIVLAF